MTDCKEYRSTGSTESEQSLTGACKDIKMSKTSGYECKNGLKTLEMYTDNWWKSNICHNRLYGALFGKGYQKKQATN